MILSAFGLGYVLLTAVGGWLVDVFGTRIVWPLAAVGWSLCVGFLGFATGFLELYRPPFSSWRYRGAPLSRDV